MTDPGTANDGLTRAVVLRALEALSAALGKRAMQGEICRFGGTAMMLGFDARLATKGVDALFQPTQPIREMARQIGEEHGLPADWINDGVKGFLSSRHETTSENLPQFPNLRLTMPVPEDLLAMKCMAGRVGGTSEEPSDLADIRFLIRHLGLSSTLQVLDIVAMYYPPNRIPAKTQYLVESLFEEDRP